MPDLPPVDETLRHLRVLLIQARDSREMEHQEQQCFAERCRLTPSQFVYANVVRDPLHRGLLNGVDAMMIGGAGAHSATKDYPWLDALFDLLFAAYEDDLPTFGSCWGHQLIGRAFGGRVIHDSARAELGCKEVLLTPEGTRDPLFRGFPERFHANMGHHDRVVDLPSNAVELAFNDSQRNQALRIEGKPMYGTQFHSELDAQRERERLFVYYDYYRSDLGSEEAMQAILDSLIDTSEIDTLLHAFLLEYAA